MFAKLNHRPLHLNRVWYNEGACKDGIIATLLGYDEKTKRHDTTLSELEYIIFPYTASEKESDDSVGAMEGKAEYVFSHEKDVKTNHVLHHVSIEDLRELLNVLNGVSLRNAEVVKYNVSLLMQSSWNETKGYVVVNSSDKLQLLEMVADIMERKYHNLMTEGDWAALFKDLLKQSRWCDDMGSERCEIILNDVFGGELINATILLFQGLTSVWFGFMDGQGRMAAIHYYERKVTPYMDGTVVPLSKTMDLRQARKRWTIQNT